MKYTSRIEILIMSAFIFIMILWATFIIMDWSMALYIVISLIITLTSTLYAIHVKKSSYPNCKNCGQSMSARGFSLIGRSEKIRRGKIIFLNTYQYDFQCDICHNKTYKKIITNSNQMPMKTLLRK